MHTNEKRNILITGVSSGIGAATALLLAERGWNVALHYHTNRAGAEAVAKQIGGKPLLLQADMGMEYDVRQMFAALKEGWGCLHGLVNNAGITASPPADDWRGMEKLLQVNTVGVMLASTLALELMDEGGAIVNISSEAARFGGNGIAAYAASKAAVNAFTLGFAREAAAKGVRVNAVSPGVVDAGTHAFPVQSAALPMKRMGEPREVAQAIAFLLSQEASYISGAILPVAGAR